LVELEHFDAGLDSVFVRIEVIDADERRDSELSLKVSLGVFTQFVVVPLGVKRDVKHLIRQLFEFVAVVIHRQSLKHKLVRLGKLVEYVEVHRHRFVEILEFFCDCFGVKSILIRQNDLAKRCYAISDLIEVINLALYIFETVDFQCPVL